MRSTKAFRGFLFLCGFAVLFLSARTASALPEARDLLEQLVTTVNEIRSFSEEVRSSSTGAGVSDSSTGSTAMMKSDEKGKTVEKFFSATKVNRKVDGKPLVHEFKTVNDGTYLWQEKRSSDLAQIVVIKDRASGSGQIAWSRKVIMGMRELWANFELEVTHEDTVAGQKTYLLEGVRKTEAPPGTAVPEVKLKLWISKDDYLPRRLVISSQMSDNKGTVVHTTDYLKVKVNEKVDPAVFTYTPPEGVQVEDISGRPLPPEPKPESTTPTTPKQPESPAAPAPKQDKP